MYTYLINKTSWIKDFFVFKERIPPKKMTSISFLKFMYIFLKDMCRVSAGSNPNIKNFELLQTWLVKLWTHLNPGSSTKTEHWTHSNPSKKLNPGPNLEKPNFEPFRTLVRLPKPNYKPSREQMISLYILFLVILICCVRLQDLFYLIQQNFCMLCFFFFWMSGELLRAPVRSRGSGFYKFFRRISKLNRY